MGIFVKVLNNFARVEFGYGSRVEFHYARGGTWGTFSV